MSANESETSPLPDEPLPPVDLLAASSEFRLLRAVGKWMIPIAGGGRAAADAIVHKPPGTAVRRGEILVEKFPGAAAAPLAPTDGRIVGGGFVKLDAQLTVPAVIFEPGVGAAPQELNPSAGPEAVRKILKRVGEIDLAGGIERLRMHGVWADRWSSPNLLGQLRGCLDKPVDTILCSVLDESPDLLLHCELAGPFAMELAAGVLALAALTGAKRPCVAMAALGDPAVWEALRYAAVGSELKIIPLRDHYPQSNPTLLIHDLTGRHLRPTRLPSESGILVLDALAAVAVGRCFLDDLPMLTVPVGIHDRQRDETYWVSVPIGMPWSEILDQLSISAKSIELRAGNPLREFRLSADTVAAGGELSVTIAPRERLANPDPCIRCAWCVEGCPVRIQPAGLLEAAQQDDPYLGDQYGLDACIECGICTYVCPSHLPILTGIRSIRASNARDASKRK